MEFKYKSGFIAKGIKANSIQEGVLSVLPSKKKDDAQRSDTPSVRCSEICCIRIRRSQRVRSATGIISGGTEDDLIRSP
jgi:hypothetical protein